MKVIEKKCWPPYFQMILDGKKSFEVRLDEGEFQEGDTLILREWSPIGCEYSGREITRTIGLVLNTRDFPFWPLSEMAAKGFQVMQLVEHKGGE